MLALGLWACGDTGTSDGRSGGVDLETHCRAWCEPETGCSNAGMTPVQCLDNCLADAERDPCFSHVVSYQECMLAMECTDPFEDCEAPGGLPRMAPDEDPMCEVFDNAHARCTCENLPQSGAGGAGGTADSRTAAQVCDEMCSWPDECFTQLGAPLEGADCMQTCEAQVGLVGVACVSAISSTIECLGTCDVESLTLEQQLACQGEAQAISAACE
jgi:hypothetical protein